MMLPRIFFGRLSKRADTFASGVIHNRSYQTRKIDEKKKQPLDKEFLIQHLETCKKYNMDLILSKSLKNYHVKGFNSIILDQSPRCMLRLYVCRPNETDLNESNNDLLIHNHGFDFQTQVLTGYMENVRYAEGKEGDHNSDGLYYKYGYESALKNSTNKIRLKLQERIPLNILQHEKIHSGNSYYMHNEELHRIYIPKEKFVSLFFWEYKQIDYTPILYSKINQNEEMSMDGYYIPFKNEKEAISIIDEVIDSIRRE